MEKNQSTDKTEICLSLILYVIIEQTWMMLLPSQININIYPYIKTVNFKLTLNKKQWRTRLHFIMQRSFQ